MTSGEFRPGSAAAFAMSSSGSRHTPESAAPFAPEPEVRRRPQGYRPDEASGMRPGVPASTPCRSPQLHARATQIRGDPTYARRTPSLRLPGTALSLAHRSAGRASSRGGPPGRRRPAQPRAGKHRPGSPQAARLLQSLHLPIGRRYPAAFAGARRLALVRAQGRLRARRRSLPGAAVYPRQKEPAPRRSRCSRLPAAWAKPA